VFGEEGVLGDEGMWLGGNVLLELVIDTGWS
jgi:hypothetical protein